MERNKRGITLIALSITIILMLILGGVIASTLGRENIIENGLSTTEKAKIESVKEEIRLAIESKKVKVDEDITIEQIIDELEKKGIVDERNSNSENGQVKTNLEGYVYEIVQDSYGNWNVNYLEQKEIEETKIILKLRVNTTVASNNVVITATAYAKSGMKSLQMPNGDKKTYNVGSTEISENYEITTNGTYSFIATNNNEDSITKNIEISNILEGIIQMNATPSTPTMQDVVVTIKWPTGKYTTIQEISINGGQSWSNYTGSQSKLTISRNCTVKARIRNGNTEIKTATLEITNIDKNLPMVTAKQNNITINEGDSNEIEKYFTVTSNGPTPIDTIKYIDTSNNVEISNTNTLSAGEHKIKCIATKKSGATANAIITLVVQTKIKGITAEKVASSPSEYYGKYVNYIVPSTGDSEAKWRIFYADTENIYLIADNCVNVQYIPQSKGGYSVGASEGYSFSFGTIYQAYTGSVDVLNASNDINGRISKWLKWIVQYPTVTNYNIRSVAYLLDTELWNVNYQNEYAEYVIGGPTLDLFNVSYKQLHTEKYIEEEINNGNGYKVKWSTDSSFSYYIEGIDTNEYEHLYIIENTKTDAYWLASTAASSGYFVMNVNYLGSVKRNTYNASLSIGSRPVICLKSKTELIKNSTTGIYELGL